MTASAPSFAIIGNSDPSTQLIDYQAGYWTCPLMGSFQDIGSFLMNNVSTNGVNPTTGNVWFLQAGQLYFRNLYGENGWTDDNYGLRLQNFNIPYNPGDSMRFQIYRDPFSGCWEQTCYNLTQGFYAYHLAGYVTGSILVQTLDSSSIWFENWNTNSDWYIGFTNPISCYLAMDGVVGVNMKKQWNNEDIEIVDNNHSLQPNTGEITGHLINGLTAYWHLDHILLGR
jgi:hypothetical protein